MIYYLLISGIIFYSLNKLFNLKNLFNPLVFVMIFHFIFFYLGLFYKERYEHITITSTAIYYINYSLIAVLAGGIFSRYIIQKTGKPYIRFPRVEMEMNNKNALIGFIFLIIGLLCTIKFIIDAGGIILLMEDIENARIEKRKGSGLILQLAINFFTYGLLTLVMIRSSFRFKALLTIPVFLCILSFGNRGPALFLLVFTIYAHQASSRKEYSLKKVTLYGAILFSLMVLFGALRTNYEADLVDLFKARFAWRPFVNIQNFQLVLNYFPKKHDFLNGLTYLQDLSMLLPGSHPNSGTFLKDFMGLKFDGGSVTPSYLGMSYVNFGYKGLILSPFLLGFISNTLYEVYVRNVNINNPLNLILLLLISFNFAAIVSSGLMTVLVQNMTIVIMVHVVYFLLQQLLIKVKIG